MDIFIHEVKLSKPENGDEHQEKFVEAFNEVSDLWSKSQDPNLSEEERKKYSDIFWQSKWMLEMGMYDYLAPLK